MQLKLHGSIKPAVRQSWQRFSARVRKKSRGGRARRLLQNLKNCYNFELPFSG
jgi:hypothetical protein